MKDQLNQNTEVQKKVEEHIRKKIKKDVINIISNLLLIALGIIFIINMPYIFAEIFYKAAQLLKFVAPNGYLFLTITAPPIILIISVISLFYKKSEGELVSYNKTMKLIYPVLNAISHLLICFGVYSIIFLFDLHAPQLEGQEAVFHQYQISILFTILFMIIINVLWWLIDPLHLYFLSIIQTKKELTEKYSEEMKK